MSDALELNVIDSAGKEVRRINLSADVFGMNPSMSLVHQTVRWQLTKRRAGTHQALTRSMMKASGKKPWKQKGTGRARAGSIVSPLWVGGASVHGPLPRKYEFNLPKRVRRGALSSVLSAKVRDNSLLVVDELAVSEPKTSEVVALLKRLKISDKKVIIIAPAVDDNLKRACRNIATVLLLDVAGVNVYDLLRFPVVLTTEAGVRALEQRVLGARQRGERSEE